MADEKSRIASLNTIRNYWKPNGRINPDNAKRIKAALKTIGVTEPVISSFLYDPVHHSSHHKVIIELGIESK